MYLAQLTDLHLRHHLFGTAAAPQRRSRLMPELLQQALRQIREQHVDLLVLTGDLLDVPTWLGSPTPGFIHDNDDLWRAAALADYQLIRSMLDRSGLRYMVLPGNHDDMALMWQVFDATENEIEIAGHRVIRFNDSEHAGHVPRRFIPERTRFEEALDHRDGLAQVHLQHYLIAPHVEGGYPFNYAEHAYLARRLQESEHVRLCLSGHYHAGTDLHRLGQATFAVGPAFSDAPFRWRVYELDGAGVKCRDFALGVEAIEKRKVVFLDRDGVINDRARYHAGPDAMRLLPGAAAAIRQLNDAGRMVVVVTNQSGVGRGFVPVELVHATNDRMCRLLAEQAGAEVDAIYAALEAGTDAVLPHFANLARPKPQPTMLIEARDELHLDFTDAWMVGDNVTDARAAAGAGVKPLLVRTGHGPNMAARFTEEFPSAPIVEDLPAAVTFILDGPKQNR